MAEVVVTTREGQTLTLAAEEGLSLMEILRDGGVDEILAICGGCCACATCHVHVDPAFAALLPPPSEEETELLSDAADVDATSRLSCQITFDSSLEGLRVRVANSA